MSKKQRYEEAPVGSSGHSKLKNILGTAAKFGGESGHPKVKMVVGTATRADETQRGGKEKAK
jgi:hypothetical protein